MRRLILLGLLGIGTSAVAHDFWIQPSRFQAAPGVPVPTVMLIGHGAARERWPGDAARVILLASVGPDGRVDHRPRFRPFRGSIDLTPVFARPGVHVLAMQTSHAVSELPAARFNDYARDEGLTPILSARSRSGQSDRPGREIYSRRAKALFRIGPNAGRADPRATQPIGLSLEIVPERDPYALGPQRVLPVHVVFEGRRLPGALVKLTNLQNDEKPVATAITDRNGRAMFRIPPNGQWLLNVVWSRPIRNDPRAEFDTTFSSLTFGFNTPQKSR